MAYQCLQMKEVPFSNILLKEVNGKICYTTPLCLEQSCPFTVWENMYHTEASIKSRGKFLEKINWEEFSRRPRKEAVANLRMRTTRTTWPDTSAE
ncbi:hypothetical protein CDAR_199781 [Caerostris darwini]|uniref:Uncharacterized protein n=1 Tax=Caerostris darwini TaxID=1538125 RepID=A0AAV4UHY3_9ARAC|nr:hypothetical protein CDAR_199781 [Caerostris darwini]